MVGFQWVHAHTSGILACDCKEGLCERRRGTGCVLFLRLHDCFLPILIVTLLTGGLELPCNITKTSGG